MLKLAKICTRLALGFGAVCVLMIAVSVLSLVRVGQTSQAVSQEKLIRKTQLSALYDLSDALDQTGIAARNAYIYEADADAIKELDVLDQQRAIYIDRLSKLEPIFAGQAAFDKVDKELQAMAKELDRPRQRGNSTDGPGDAAERRSG